MRDGSVGTHNYASLQPTASPAQGSAVQAWDSSHAVVRLTTIGEIAHQNWLDIPKHFPFVVLDESIVMPNHIHGILYFRKPGYRGHGPNSFGPQSENLGSVIRNYKGAIKAYATSREIEFAWQARYHDDVITSRNQLDRVRAYIRNNPARWVQNETIKTLAKHERPPTD
jgi:REP element-mobilizing transposase RayT